METAICLKRKREFIFVYDRLGCRSLSRSGIWCISDLLLWRATWKILVWGEAVDSLLRQPSRMVEPLAGCVLALLLWSFQPAGSNQPFIIWYSSDQVFESHVARVLIGQKIPPSLYLWRARVRPGSGCMEPFKFLSVFVIWEVVVNMNTSNWIVERSSDRLRQDHLTLFTVQFPAAMNSLSRERLIARERERERERERTGS